MNYYKINIIHFCLVLNNIVSNKISNHLTHYIHTHMHIAYIYIYLYNVYIQIPVSTNNVIRDT